MEMQYDWAVCLLVNLPVEHGLQVALLPSDAIA
jgi:hypothetical protein